jgi:hypothetical protein
MESDWGTLKAAIADYWMNHSWLEDQKFRANTAQYWETEHARETPSEYVIRKMDLLWLVYDYTDSEIIRLIMKEAPDAWFSILQAQFYKTLVQFQNTVKYHKSTLLTMPLPTSTTPSYSGNPSDNPSGNPLISDKATGKASHLDLFESTHSHDPRPS